MQKQMITSSATVEMANSGEIRAKIIGNPTYRGSFSFSGRILTPSKTKYLLIFITITPKSISIN